MKTTNLRSYGPHTVVFVPSPSVSIHATGVANEDSAPARKCEPNGPLIVEVNYLFDGRAITPLSTPRIVV